MKKLLLAMLLICFAATSAFAVAHTIVRGSQTICITPTGDVDFDLSAYFDQQSDKVIEFIEFRPSAALDVICILDGSDLGPALLHATSIDGGNLIIYPGIKCRPYLDYSGCTFGTAANARITIGYR